MVGRIAVAICAELRSGGQARRPVYLDTEFSITGYAEGKDRLSAPRFSATIPVPRRTAWSASPSSGWEFHKQGRAGAAWRGRGGGSRGLVAGVTKRSQFA